MQNLKVALIQTEQFWEDKSANLLHYETKFLADLLAEEVDLVILPEMLNTSFSMNVKSLAESMDGSTINWMINWANELNTEIGGSLIIREGDNYMNRFVIVDKTGVLTYYDKRHLFRMADEEKYFTPGTNRVIHEIKGWKILLQVCYDLRFPVFSRNRNVNGWPEYDALVYIANWPKKRNQIWTTLLHARAIENQAYGIGVNRVGMDGNQIEYSGDSILVDPWGNKVFQFSQNIEMLKILTLDPSVLQDVRNRFPAFKDAD